MRLMVLSSVLVSFCVFGCSATPTPPVETAGGGVDHQGEPVVVAGGEDGFAGPAHVFRPRQHPPHRPPQVVVPSLASLPKMKLSQCFRDSEEERKSKRSSGLGRSGTIGHGSGPGNGLGYGSGSGRAPSKPMPAPPPRTATPSPQLPPASAPVGAAPPPALAAPEPAAASGDWAAADESVEEAKSEAAASPKDSRREQEMAAAEAPVQEYDDWGSSIYLSNDDTMSLSSAQRVIFAIDGFLPLPAEHIRPHELLNYFSFETAQGTVDDDFSVLAEIEEKPGEPGVYSLGLAVAGRPLDTATRRNASLTFVIDRSGSMSDEGRMSYLKQGLTRMTDELKTGDLVNLVLFDHEVCVPVENFVVGRDSMDAMRNTLAQLEPRGSTDVHLGLKKGYQLADQSYQSTFSNRVVLITDALANTGVTDEGMISMIGEHFDRRRIRLSGVGVGKEFNDALLDRLTERGKGAYVFLGSQAEVDAVFGDRFVSLIETVANDVHFQLHLPPSMRMNVFYGEESSTVKEDVQAVHYFAGTSQLFLSDLMARGGALRPQDSVMLTVEYEHPETGQELVEEFAFNLGEISRHVGNVQKGRMVMSFVDGLHDIAQRTPERTGYTLGSWVDHDAFAQCQLGAESLQDQRRGLEGDPEVERVVSLWERYCSRYERPSHAVTRPQPRGRDVWPGAR
jgi:hypothetical protein